MNQTPHHLARMQPDVGRITAERDRLKTALGRVFAAARYMSLEHPVEAAAIFAAMGAPADGLAEMVAAGGDLDAADLLLNIREMEARWSVALDRGCPSCGPHMETCDHIEGYHHALSDLWEALGMHPERRVS